MDGRAVLEARPGWPAFIGLCETHGSMKRLPNQHGKLASRLDKFTLSSNESPCLTATVCLSLVSLSGPTSRQSQATPRAGHLPDYATHSSFSWTPTSASIVGWVPCPTSKWVPIETVGADAPTLYLPHIDPTDLTTPSDNTVCPALMIPIHLIGHCSAYTHKKRCT